MISGIVLTHGTIGKALIKAAKSILGEIDHIHDISTTGHSLESINTKLKNMILSQNWEDGTLIMASLMGGSCWNAGVVIAHQMPNIEVVSGVNLIMLISFLSKRDRHTLVELSEIVKQDGIRGISRLS
ncbi:MAG TPA: hypothetical protein VGD14_02430 [bacterium]